MSCCGTPLSFFKPVIAIVGLVAVGVGGYNLATTGCPLGGCLDGASDANIVQTAGPATDGACPLGGCSGDMAEAAECSMEAVCETACTEAMKEACHEAKAACEGMAAEACHEATACEGEKVAADCCGCSPERCEEACREACETMKAAKPSTDGESTGG